MSLPIKVIIVVNNLATLIKEDLRYRNKSLKFAGLMDLVGLPMVKLFTQCKLSLANLSKQSKLLLMSVLSGTNLIKEIKHRKSINLLLSTFKHRISPKVFSSCKIN